MAGRLVAATVLPVSFDPQLSRDDLELIALAAAAAAALALLLVLFALARLRALNKKLRRLAATPSRATASAGGNDPHALRHVGVVRYDAFGDMGGRLSFSAAVYDDNGDGIVLSSINGRSETRTYAKALSDLSSDQKLSPEEQDAITAARRG
jgi:uncharacterized protein DUF4446